MPTSPVVMSCLDNHARPLRLTIALRSTCARTASDSLISLKRRAMRLGSHKQRAEATSAQLPIYAFFFPRSFANRREQHIVAFVVNLGGAGGET
ncbi:hypothetical protein HBH56_017560 [Parastagonospora nodorum]|uniref:Uncharacterized protein n=1 Tax=Phaeosphaeria nodorum (strain SN15 / ATCC MYA-4574 / FGSC 10173) TaxID=321614 RepID=A0A7U2EYG7_PHANO|nr:hypothetical protein HBH56_017560 [Parastagonospora nodorum]QRC95196.1 hypothetical protein JI435_407020 [Parastagonospora nodorum SN15]KAH3937285.1 hypothetical protein HBH54_016920 [Parastagonospora nodorum]KAH4006606.1 hypothetical protein HBI10_016710 [Parastagonospora nodorum]KAH4025849.1 hypothetical protein HBI13_070640 [Parastagonospora nodorum]